MPQSWLKPSLQLVWRTVKGVLLTALVVLLPAILAGLLMVALEKMMPEAAANHATTMTGAAMLLAIIIILMELPMAYVLMKYVMEPANGFWKTLRPAYSRGLHHWAQIFTVLFISTLITTIIIAVMMLPAHILYIANEQAHAGLLIGDELGMPSYITPLTFFTFTLCSLLAFYVGLLNIIHTYYLYGNIEYRSQES
jgi:hypothetical protein